MSKSDSNPATSEFLSESGKKYRRAVMAISMGVLLLWWCSPNVDWSKLPVVGALDVNKQDAVRTALGLLLIGLVWNGVLYAYNCWRDWGDWVRKVTRTTDDAGKSTDLFPQFNMYFGAEPKGRLLSLDMASLTWTREAGGDGSLKWLGSFKSSVMAGPVFRSKTSTESAIRHRYYADFLTLAVALPGTLAITATAALVWLMVYPPAVKPSTDKPAVTIVYAPGFGRVVPQSFPPVRPE